MSEDGTLLYLSGLSPPVRRLVWIDEAGQVEPIFTREQQMVGAVSLSPDGVRALVPVLDEQTDLGAMSGSIWMHDINAGRANRVTFPPQGAIDYLAEWHPDGEHIVFARRNWDTGSGDSRQRTIMMGRADGTGEAVEIVVGAVEFSLSMDGKYLAYDSPRKKGRDLDIAYISLEEDGPPQFLRSSPAIERGPAISPDGRLVAYSSDESGQFELYITQFPSGEGRWLVSHAGGRRKFWGRDRTNQVLYYEENHQILYRVSVKFDERHREPEIGKPEKLLDLHQLELAARTLEPARDGNRFLTIQSVGSAQRAKTNVVLVENWFSEFKSRENE